MADAETLEELAHAEYWNQRYSSSSDSSYEWFKSFETLKPFLCKHLPDPFAGLDAINPRILHLGCGNSVCALVVVTMYITEVFLVDTFVVVDTSDGYGLAWL